MDLSNSQSPIYTHYSVSNNDFGDLMNLPAEKKNDVLPSYDFTPVHPALDSSSPTADRSSNLDSGNEDASRRAWNSVDSQINSPPVRGENEDAEAVKRNKPTTLPKKQFSRAEDEALISAFINVSTGGNQKKEALWNKIKTLYDEARKANPTEMRERSTGMLNNQFRRIASGVMKFVDCYDEACSKRKSGVIEVNVFKCALDIYGEKFKFENCWILLKNYPRYKEVIAAYCDNKSRPQDNFRTRFKNLPMPTNHDGVVIDGSGKRARLNEGERASASTRCPDVKAAKKKKCKGKVGTESLGQLSESLTDVKAAKKKKCKGKVGTESLGQLSESLTNLAKSMIDPKYYWEKLSFSKSKEAARRAEKQAELALEKQKIEIESRNMNMQLLHTLLQKEILDERAERLKNGLLKELGF